MDKQRAMQDAKSDAIDIGLFGDLVESQSLVLCPDRSFSNVYLSGTISPELAQITSLGSLCAALVSDAYALQSRKSRHCNSLGLARTIRTDSMQHFRSWKSLSWKSVSKSVERRHARFVAVLADPGPPWQVHLQHRHLWLDPDSVCPVHIAAEYVRSSALRSLSNSLTLLIDVPCSCSYSDLPAGTLSAEIGRFTQLTTL
eukprot:6210545-Pleurochrysis_carterae.AAC.2